MDKWQAEQELAAAKAAMDAGFRGEAEKTRNDIARELTTDYRRPEDRAFQELLDAVPGPGEPREEPPKTRRYTTSVARYPR